MLGVFEDRDRFRRGISRLVDIDASIWEIIWTSTSETVKYRIGKGRFRNGNKPINQK
jgi:hypothetical protein